MVLVAREAIYCIGHQDVRCTLPEKLTGPFNTWALQGEATGGIPNALHDLEAIGLGVLHTGPLLSFQRCAVSLLGVR